jgi:tungstate transport system ATP-binding protein
MTNTIRFENVEKVYGDRVLLSIDEFSISAGECILITGDNGAGKTTFLKIVSGLLKPEKALVAVGRETLSWPRAKPGLRSAISYLHQSPYMFDATVYDNVAYGLRAARLPRAQIDELVWESLHWGKLDHLTHRNAKVLSGGEKQRVALTRARIIQPQFLVLDEPTTSMDRRSRHQTYGLIQQLRHENMTIVISTHDIEPFLDIVSRHHFLEGGHLHDIAIPSRSVDHKSRGVVTTLQRQM